MSDEKIRSPRWGQISLQRHNKWRAYFCVMVVFVFLAGCDTSDVKRAYFSVVGYRAWEMPASSMEPTLKVGDHFIVRCDPYIIGKPRREDVVSFPYPEDRSKTFVKRVVGLGGETLEILNKQVFINGQPLEESYKRHIDSKVLPAHAAPRDNFGPVSIPEGSVFVMGHNRDYSLDSRLFGSIRVADVEGKALYIYWGSDLSRIGRLE
ncbi:MAG: signal peptidase I [Desulfomonile tiedjei]|nr:signal peptidase I [Desulfomonile tiedjei]